MSFEANIENYSGPLDLMLHLISDHKLNIFALDINVLCDQYLAYLKRLQQHHLEIESDYLVELATLIEMKSRRLLPQPEKRIEEDPQERLVQRLLEYQRYKEASETLAQAFSNRQELLAKPAQDFFDFDEEKERYEGHSSDLYKAMNRVLRRILLNKPLETKWTKREVSLEDCTLKIQAKLYKLPSTFPLKELLDDVKDRYELVLSILAILDLVKNQHLFFYCDEQEHLWFAKGGSHADMLAKL